LYSIFLLPDTGFMPVRDLIPMYLRHRLMELRGRSIYSGLPDQYRTIFIHVPRTAGTSMSRALFATGSRHVTYERYLQANRRKFDAYFKFAFVRNPWDRLVSAYLFLQKGGMDAKDARFFAQHLASYPSFEKFVLEWVNESNVLLYDHFIPQHRFICDARDRIMVDFVGRKENLELDFAYVASRMGRPAALPHINKVEHRHYSTYYNEATRAIAERVYIRDIRIFGYSFQTEQETAAGSAPRVGRITFDASHVAT
jgi:hypothetical protein